MRLDKYLQVSRLIKRRSLANHLCDGGHVSRNGRVARASAEVDTGDQIQIDYGWRRLTIRVCRVPTGQVAKAAASELYEIIAEERRQEETSAGEE